MPSTAAQEHICLPAAMAAGRAQEQGEGHARSALPGPCPLPAASSLRSGTAPSSAADFPHLPRRRGPGHGVNNLWSEPAAVPTCPGPGGGGCGTAPQPAGLLRRQQLHPSAGRLLKTQVCLREGASHPADKALIFALLSQDRATAPPPNGTWKRYY